MAIRYDKKLNQEINRTIKKGNFKKGQRNCKNETRTMNYYHLKLQRKI